MDRVLVTGCSSGIGRALAVELTKRGYEVVATARRPETLDDLDVAVRLALDVTSDASVAAAVAAAGRVDVLVNNAGVGIDGPIEKVPLDAVREMFETNVFGAARMIQAVVPGMRARGVGTVVNVTALSGRVPGPLNGYFAASKHALEAISESLHLEASRFGIRVLVVEPGIVHSDFEANRRTFGVDQPPYDALRRAWEAGRSSWEAMLRMESRGLSGPEMAAAAIADALESGERRLRVPIGTDAELILATRDSMDFESFEDTMRATLGIDW